MCEVCQGARRAGSKGHSTWPSKRELCLLTAVLFVRVSLRCHTIPCCALYRLNVQQQQERARAWRAP